MKTKEVSKRRWTITAAVFFTLGVAAGVWMQLNSSPVETIAHTLQLKHSWVQPVHLVFMATSMVIATVAVVRLRKWS